MKNRKRRNRESFYKICLLLVSVASVIGLQLYAIREEPVVFRSDNEIAVPASFSVKNKQTEKYVQEVEEKKINLNSASLEDLIKLPGIGEKTAKKMLEYKEKNGPFRSIEAVMEVKGIGSLKFEKIKSFITIN